MSPAVVIASWASGLFLFVGLLTGTWKYVSMVRTEDHRAPFYVDTAHRASLMYAFASLVLAHLAGHTRLGPTGAAWAVAVPVVFFGTAIARYVMLGAAGKTDNQFRTPSFATGIGMWLLVLGECGGVLALLVSFRPG